jgi:WD40 repeat protein
LLVALALNASGAAQAMDQSQSVYCARFSPDGKLFATGGEECVAPSNLPARPGAKVYPSYLIRLWDMQTRRELRRIEAHQWLVESLDFSPDGKTLVSGSFDGTVKLWEVEGGRLIRVLGGK